MLSPHSLSSRRLVPKLAVVTALAAACAVWLGELPRPVDAAAPAHHVMSMTNTAMKRASDAWWTSHPRVGSAAPQGTLAAATFTVVNFRFDLDNNASTQVDTAKIQVGQSVLWQWVQGFHTVTSGTTAGDPQAGFLFDQPSDNAHTQFTFTFNTAGTFPFFCRIHDPFMAGVVVVKSATDVGPRGGTALGFTADPAPNPTAEGIRFQFALRTPGRAKAEVFDTRGRRIATVLDREFPAGPVDAAWNGRTRLGPASAGVYYLRLQIPGLVDSRRIVITH